MEVNMAVLYQGIIQGFATGIGVCLANWFLIKRLEGIEFKLREKVNGGK